MIEKLNVLLDKRRRTYFFLILVVALLCFVADKAHYFSKEIRTNEIEWVYDASMESDVCRYVDFSLNEGIYNINFTALPGTDASWKIVDYCQNDGFNRLGKIIAEGEIKSVGIEHYLDSDMYSYTEDFEVVNDSNQLSLVIEDDSHSTLLGNSVQINLIKENYTDAILAFIFISGLITIFYVKRLYEKKEIVILSVALLILSLLMLEPSLKDGDDILFHMNRIKGIASELRRCHIPSIINTEYNYSYGVETSIFYPELFLYPSAVLMIMGMSLASAYKCLILLINAITIFLSYFSFRKIIKSDRMAIIATMLYTFAPYRMTNVYVRAAIGESLAMAFLPYLIFSIYALLCDREKMSWVHSALAISAVLQSHILSLEISGGIIAIIGFIYTIHCVYKREYIVIVRSICASVCTLLLNLWFIVPFVLGMRNGDVGIARNWYPGNYAIHPWLLVTTLNDMAGSMSRSRSMGSMFVSVGSATAIGCAYFLYRVHLDKQNGQSEVRLAEICFMLGIVSAWMSTYFFPWHILERSNVYQYISIIQFAWRMCEFATVFAILPATIGIKYILDDNKRILAYAILFLFVLSSVNCLDGSVRDISNVIETRNECVKNSKNVDYYKGGFDYSSIQEYGDTARVLDNTSVDISSYIHEGTDIEFTFKKDEKVATVLMPLYDYGCYRVYLNGEEINEYRGEESLVSFELPAEIKDGEVWVRYIVKRRNVLSLVISIATAIVLLAYILFVAKRNGYNRSYK